MSDQTYDTMATEETMRTRSTESRQIYTMEPRPELVGNDDTITIQRAKLELLLEKFNSAAIAAKQAATICTIATQSMETEAASFRSCYAAVSELITTKAHRPEDRMKQ